MSKRNTYRKIALTPSDCRSLRELLIRKWNKDSRWEDAAPWLGRTIRAINQTDL